jgi:hypothetical protein
MEIISPPRRVKAPTLHAMITELLQHAAHPHAFHGDPGVRKGYMMALREVQQTLEHWYHLFPNARRRI